MPASTSPVPAFASAGVPSPITATISPSDMKLFGPLTSAVTPYASEIRRASSPASSVGKPKGAASRAASPAWGVTTVSSPDSKRSRTRLRPFFVARKARAPPSTTSGAQADSSTVKASFLHDPLDASKPGPRTYADGWPARVGGKSLGERFFHERTTREGLTARTASTDFGAQMTSVYPAPIR